MKNLAIFVFAIMAVAFVGCGGNSELRLGDISPDEVVKVKGVYLDLIKNYQVQEESLREKNNVLIIQAQDTLSDIPHSELLKQININDALAVSYRTQITLLEEELNSFVARSIGKDKLRSVKMSISGGNLRDMASTLAIFDYHNKSANAVGTDSAAVISFAFGIIRADVYLDGRRIVSCFLSSAKPVKIIKIPGPGYYEVCFTDVNSDKTTKSGRFVDCVAKDIIDQGEFAFVSTVGKK